MARKKDYKKMSLGEKYTSIYDSFQTIIDNQRYIDERIKQLNTTKATKNRKK